MSSLKDQNKFPASVCAVIPFYNEKENLNKVLIETSKYVNYIFAINDGSDDALYENEMQRTNVKFIKLDKNYGKGKALAVGFEAAILSGFEYIITLDADLQHEPKYIPKLLEGLQIFDVVVGNRLKDMKGMPFQRKLSNRLTSLLLSLKTGQKILDSQCGYRAYSSRVLRVIKTRFNGFEAESEILVKTAKKGFKIGFVDIPTIYRNEKSKMQPIKATIGFLKVLLIGDKG